MSSERRAPRARHVIWAIARRELGIAFRRKLVRTLFIGSLLPPLIMAGVLVGRVLARQATGVDLGWDPILWLLSVQAFPVALLSLGLGTPAVARDRAEEVLYLYAVRPVSPGTYTAGKMLAVALPAFLLLLVPSVLLAAVRQGILDGVTTGDSLTLVGKAAVGSVFLAVGFSGVCVGPSAATRRGRWALLIALVLFGLPEPFKIAHGMYGMSIGPGSAGRDLLVALFEGGHTALGFGAAGVLLAYAAAGAAVTVVRVRGEMRP